MARRSLFSIAGRGRQRPANPILLGNSDTQPSVRADLCTSVGEKDVGEKDVGEKEQSVLPMQLRRIALVMLLPALCLASLFLVGQQLQAQAHSSALADAITPSHLRALAGDSQQESLSNPQDDDDPGDRDQNLYSAEYEGEVLRRPSNEQGMGAWLIRSDRGISYWAYADDETEFKPAIAAVGQRVKIRGAWVWYMSSYWFVASKVEIQDGDDEDNVEGILLSAPTDGIGTWVIQTGLTQTIGVEVSTGTRLDDGVPPIGNWLEVRGDWQDNGKFTATRVREDTHEINEVIVRLRPDVISTTVASRYELDAVDTLLASAHIYRFTTDEDEEEDTVERLMADEDVIWAELNFTNGIPERHGYKTWRWGGEDPDGYINQNAFTQVNLAPVLTTLQGEGMIVAVLDTGVALDHQAFAGRLLAGYDMVDDDTVPNDDGDGLGWGHGTHIAGIIAQTSPQSKLLPIRVLDTNGRGNTFTLAYAIEWAVANGADVINLSLGAEADSQVLRSAVAHAVEEGVIVVAAAGNIHTDTPQFPASYPNVLSVTAVDGQNIKAEFAAFGEDWVDLAAPGVGITSTIVGPQGLGYASWSGTSMATGFVSGAAALLRQQRPQASILVINQQLMVHARNVDMQNPEFSGKLGGLLDIAAALEMNPTQATATPTPTPIQPSLTPSPTTTPAPGPTLLSTPTPTATPTTVTPITTALPEEEEPQTKTYLPLILR